MEPFALCEGAMPPRKKGGSFFFKWAFFEIRKKKGSKYKLQSTPINNSCIETGKLRLPCSCASQNTGAHTHVHTSLPLKALKTHMS